MPELPEVETIRRDMECHIKGQIISRIEVRNKYLRWPVDSRIIKLREQVVLNVKRRARYLLLELENGWIIIHFGMSGYLNVLMQPKYPEKHDHLDLIINDKCIIRYTDPRRFGAWLWSNNPYKNKTISHLGPEPLSDDFNGQWLYQKSRNKRIAIKSWLMDNKLVAGIGNIYANESLFISGILPNRIASSLSEKETALLSKNIKALLLNSIENRGTTLRNFIQLNGKPGCFGQKLQVYARNGKPCIICQTPIKLIKQNRRSTFLCTTCQH